jgi:Galactose oxidase, central domain
MGTWISLAHQPGFNADTMLLLTDGTVMCHDEGPALGGSPRWHRLTPDKQGSYINGTWSALASAPNSPLYFASAVLDDGRVFVAGGEYDDGLNWDLLAVQLYNPVSNTWSVASLPPGWTNIGDAPSCVLPDGRVLLGSIGTNKTAIYDPNNNTWVAAAEKKNPSSSEETWTLLPDQSILSVDCQGNPGAQKYIIAADEWVQIPPTPSDLVEASSIEIGPAILLPDGNVFAIGATGHTAFYHMPPIASQPGTWSAGRDFPAQPGHPTLGAKDAPACLLPNGKILCVAGPVDGIAEDYLAPMYFFELDPATGIFTLIAVPPSNLPNLAPFEARFLPLPSGDILFSNGTDNISIYEPGGSPDPVWRPTITGIEDLGGNPASALAANNLFRLFGRQLNGLSQAASYGDDAQMATNYPLVRIRNNASHHVAYCRTQNHSSMGVATGSIVRSTEFHVPSGIEPGVSELRVIANGIASAPMAVTIV